MAAGKAYQYYHLEEEMRSQLLHAQLLLYPSHHHSSSSKQSQATTRSYHEYEWKQRHTRRPRERLPNWATCEPGMHPVFLGPAPTSCGGTGVFLPQIPPLHFQPNAKPPLRPPPPHAGGGQERGCGNNNNKKGKGSNFSLQSRRSSSNSNSPGVFLPKEWTY